MGDGVENSKRFLVELSESNIEYRISKFEKLGKSWRMILHLRLII
jgi:hypothetical protein